VFWSHVQSEGFLNYEIPAAEGEYEMLLGTLRFIHKTIICEKQSPFLWVDYFCLRQCQPDFTPQIVCKLIKEIGTLATLIGFSIYFPPMCALRIENAQFAWAPYLERSFCILELYAAVIGGAEMICNSGWKPADVQKLLEKSKPDESWPWAAYWRGPIDSKAASTRRTEDKELIDQFITDSIGFEQLNKLITEALCDNSANQEHINEGLRRQGLRRGTMALTPYRYRR
jgi:hypothetical protein